MGSSSSKATKTQEESAKEALSNMCESVANAIVKVAQLEGPLTSLQESTVTEATKEVLKLCGMQAKQTTSEIVKAIRRQNFVRMMAEEVAVGGSSGSNDGTVQRMKELQKHLLFLELLRVALDDATSDDSSSGSERGATGRTQMVKIAQSWEKERILGQGSFGTVYAAVDENGFKFAVKEVPKHCVEEKALRDEAKILGQLQHRNIVKFFGIAGNRENIFMFIELMQGSIKDKIDKSKAPIPQEAAKKFTRDILQGLIYLHGKDIIHRDIKCANVLVDKSDTAKLADMGISKIHAQPTAVGEPEEKIAGTICWMSPEAVSGQQCGKRSDVWSVGCTVYEMVKGMPPFADGLPLILLPLILPRMIQNLEHRNLVRNQDELGRGLQAFLLRIFVKIDDRPFAEDIANHHWMRSQ